MTREPTYGEVQATAVRLTHELVKRIAAGDDDLSPAERFVAVMFKLDADCDGSPPETVAVSRNHYLVMRELANDIMLNAAREVLSSPPPTSSTH